MGGRIFVGTGFSNDLGGLEVACRCEYSDQDLRGLAVATPRILVGGHLPGDLGAHDGAFGCARPHQDLRGLAARSNLPRLTLDRNQGTCYNNQGWD